MVAEKINKLLKTEVFIVKNKSHKYKKSRNNKENMK